MSNEQKKEQNVFVCNRDHRGSYVNIVEANAFKKNGQAKGPPKFGATFIMDPTPKLQNVDGKEVDMSDLGRLKREVIKMLTAKNPGKKFVTRRLTQEELDAGNVIEVAVPWKDGTKEADKMKAAGKDGEAYRGHVIVKASSKFQPIMSAYENKQITVFETEEQKAAAKKFFYSGAHFVPSFGLNWYKGDEGKPDGVSLYLNSIMFAKHGSRIGGVAQNPAETFKGYIGSISAEDPTGGFQRDEMDDEIPF